MNKKINLPYAKYVLECIDEEHKGTDIKIDILPKSNLNECEAEIYDNIAYTFYINMLFDLKTGISSYAIDDCTSDMFDLFLSKKLKSVIIETIYLPQSSRIESMLVKAKLDFIHFLRNVIMEEGEGIDPLSRLIQ